MMSGASDDKMKVLIAVSHSTIKGYSFPSISSTNAFQWLLNKLITPTSVNHFHLVILHVKVYDSDDDDNDSVYAATSDLKHTSKKEMQLQLLDSFVKQCDERKVSCEALLRQGDPKDVICKEAVRMKPDMLVLGSRNLGSVKRMFVATVSDYCTNHAPCPVLVIKRKPDDAPDDASDD